MATKLIIFLIIHWPNLVQFKQYEANKGGVALGNLGSAVSSPSGVWGKAPAEIKFSVF